MYAYEGVEYRRDSIVAIQTALIELLTLAKTKMILGSMLSSYSEVASNYNNIPLVTVVYSTIEED